MFQIFPVFAVILFFSLLAGVQSWNYAKKWVELISISAAKSFGSYPACFWLESKVGIFANKWVELISIRLHTYLYICILLILTTMRQTCRNIMGRYKKNMSTYLYGGIWLSWYIQMNITIQLNVVVTMIHSKLYL